MSIPRQATDPLEELVAHLPEWRAHARAAGRAWLRSWLPYRTRNVLSGLPDSTYLIVGTWRWRGRIIRRSAHHA